jgi:hypothetical protein
VNRRSENETWKNEGRNKIKQGMIHKEKQEGILPHILTPQRIKTERD